VYTVAAGVGAVIVVADGSVYGACTSAVTVKLGGTCKYVAGSMVGCGCGTDSAIC